MAIQRTLRTPLVALVAAVLVVPLAAQAPPAPAPQPDPAPAPSTAPAPPPATGRVYGKILQADGKTPLAGATVRATHLRSSQTIASAPTGSNGEFTLPPVPYGYLDVAVETPDGVFLANEVVNVPPDGKVALTFTLTRFEQLPQAWWAGRDKRDLPGGASAAGVAELQRQARGRDFWKSPKGVAILAGAGAVALAAVASGGGSEDASPFTP